MIRIGKLEAVLSAVSGAEAKDLRNRLQYLATLHFPPGLRVGSARRASYGLEEVFALCVVFALTRAGVAPATGAGIVSDFWPEIARALIRVSSRGGSHRPDAKPDFHEYMLSTAARLPTVVRGAGEVRASGRSFAIRIGRLDELDLPSSIGSGAAGLIDLDFLYRSMEAALVASPNAVSERTIQAEIEETRERQSRSPLRPSSDLPLAPVRFEPPPQGFTLRDADYYFTRVAEIATRASASDGTILEPDQRTALLLHYVARPDDHELWKKHVGLGGIEFFYAVAVLTSRVFDESLGVPHTLVAGAVSRLEDAGIIGMDALVTAIQDVAIKGANYRMEGPDEEHKPEDDGEPSDG